VPNAISASMLYDYVQCPHRLELDLFEDPSKRDLISPFVQLLWERGINFEKEVIDNLKIPFLDLSEYSGYERITRTNEAIEAGEKLIYGGRIKIDDLIGDPDLLRKESSGYVAGDIKSGAGLEGVSDLSEGKPKEHYAVQLAQYTNILEKLEKSAGRSPFVWDINGEEITYNLDSSRGPRTPDSMWQEYEMCLETARKIVNREIRTTPALSSGCKLCHWRTLCFEALKKKNDLSLIPYLGRSRRDAIESYVKSIAELADASLGNFIQGKKTIFPRIGISMLHDFQERAKLLMDPKAKPYLKEPISLPDTDAELFFDIETDPFRDICYLHGFVERRGKDNGTERYSSFFAENPTPEEEKRAFSEAWAYIQSNLPCAIYFYATHEITHWKKLQAKYPDIVSREEIEDLFGLESTIDLYNKVVRKTEWPTHDHSIKTLAAYLGFHWRDQSPSGAESIEWYHQWVEKKQDDIKERILEYNEDDCRAMRVLLDGIRILPFFEK
jgi:predicted RecB family nuclease